MHTDDIQITHQQKTPEEALREFIQVFEMSQPGMFWMRLISEEADELDTEIRDYLDKTMFWTDEERQALRGRVLKEICDLMYVLAGFTVAENMKLNEAFNRVHASNMSKLVDGKPLRRDDGKVLKGPNYKPPYLLDLV